LQTWDTAFEKNSGLTIPQARRGGFFTNDEDDMPKNIILLNTYKKRVEWVDLKRDVLKEYNEYEPDGLLD
jgi:hypothetical protein